MSSTPRTHSNTLSLEDTIKYQQAVDRKAQKLMPSTDNEIKQTSADTAKALSHESKEKTIQNPYTEFTEKFKGWFDDRISQGNLSEEGYRAAEEFIKSFDNYKTIDGLQLLRSGSIILDDMIVSFFFDNIKSFSENTHAGIVSSLRMYDGNDKDTLNFINISLKQIAESTSSIDVAKRLAGMVGFPRVRENLCYNKVILHDELRKIILENKIHLDDDMYTIKAARNYLDKK